MEQKKWCALRRLYSNTTLVKVKFGECQNIIEQIRKHSNTTLVKVKFGSKKPSSIAFKAIQIQHLLKLNLKRVSLHQVVLLFKYNTC